MNIFEIERDQFAALAARGGSGSVVFGLISEHDFVRARPVVAGLEDYDDYADWLDAREGFQMAHSLAGVDAAPVLVEFEAFLRWCRQTESAPSVAALDRLAVLAHAFAGSRRPAVFARVDEREFAQYSQAVPALQVARDSVDWRERRARTRSRAAGLGLHVEEMPVRMEAFVGWCDCLGQAASESALDRYAQLLLEELTTEATAAVVNHVLLR
jgi:hypothetical protein